MPNFMYYWSDQNAPDTAVEGLRVLTPFPTKPRKKTIGLPLPKRNQDLDTGPTLKARASIIRCTCAATFYIVPARTLHILRSLVSDQISLFPWFRFSRHFFSVRHNFTISSLTYKTFQGGDLFLLHKSSSTPNTFPIIPCFKFFWC